VLVLGRDDLLPTLGQVPVIPLSTQIRGLGWEVLLEESDGVPARCTLKPEWIKSVERAAIGPRLGTLPGSRWPEVRAALLDILGPANETLH
jgi:mRNA-degrading endonuclease toxin of MazEF toxin-antitoxin module